MEGTYCRRGDMEDGGAQAEAVTRKGSPGWRHLYRDPLEEGREL